MFFKHFNLTRHPFAENLNVDDFLCDQRLEKALARLRFFQQSGNLALILGQTGAGKTSLLRLYQTTLPKNRYRPVYLHLTHIGANGLLRMIVAELGEAPKLGKDRLFMQLAERVKRTDAETLLFIDEAHLLPSLALTDLRLLISAGLDAALPLKVILCGQDSLGVLLKRSAHEDLVNRICVRVRMAPMTKTETAAYIDHRIRKADGSDRLFDGEAKALIHEYSGGVCRQVNNIATACLIQAHAKNMQQISDIVVNETMVEFNL